MMLSIIVEMMPDILKSVTTPRYYFHRCKLNVKENLGGIWEMSQKKYSNIRDYLLREWMPTILGCTGVVLKAL